LGSNFANYAELTRITRSIFMAVAAFGKSLICSVDAPGPEPHALSGCRLTPPRDKLPPVLAAGIGP